MQFRHICIGVRRSHVTLDFKAILFPKICLAHLNTVTPVCVNAFNTSREVACNMSTARLSRLLGIISCAKSRHMKPKLSSSGLCCFNNSTLFFYISYLFDV